jgi:hypothetical protein
MYRFEKPIALICGRPRIPRVARAPNDFRKSIYVWPPGGAKQWAKLSIQIGEMFQQVSWAKVAGWRSI